MRTRKEFPSDKLAARIAGYAALVLAGCASTDLTKPGAPEVEVFGRSIQERPIRGTVLGSGPETILLLGVIHGNEPLGGPLLERLAERFAQSPRLLAGKRVVIVPVLNPDGLANRRRANARGVDLNRNFPADNWRPSPRHGESPASEPETRALLKILRQFRPSRILSIHSPLHCVNYDGPAKDLARTMARAVGYPLRSSVGYATPGSLGSYTGEDLSIPTITLELAPRATEDGVWPILADAFELFVTAEHLVAEK